MKRLSTILVLLVVGISLIGCGVIYHPYLRQLELGMDRDQALEVMGEPYKSDSYTIGETTVENWYYISKPYAGPPLDSDLTALTFEDEALVAWGRQPR